MLLKSESQDHKFDKKLTQTFHLNPSIHQNGHNMSLNFITLFISWEKSFQELGFRTVSVYRTYCDKIKNYINQINNSRNTTEYNIKPARR